MKQVRMIELAKAITLNEGGIYTNELLFFVGFFYYYFNKINCKRQKSNLLKIIQSHTFGCFKDTKFMKEQT